MKLGHIEILARDPSRSQHFYHEVLGFELTVVHWQQFIWLKKGDLEVLIRPGNPPEPDSRYEEADTGFVLYASDVDGMLHDLVERGLEVKGTVDSDTCYTFTDPDGNWFQLVDPDDH
jgi:catechol 2,3-dioxygenase-like lactoylglutathione lyase family enzyme